MWSSNQTRDVTSGRVEFAAAPVLAASSNSEGQEGGSVSKSKSSWLASKLPGAFEERGSEVGRKRNFTGPLRTLVQSTKSES